MKYFKKVLAVFGRPYKMYALREELGQKLETNVLNDNTKLVAGAELLVYKHVQRNFIITAGY